jgi:hypothetical protein
MRERGAPGGGLQWPQATLSAAMIERCIGFADAAVHADLEAAHPIGLTVPESLEVCGDVRVGTSVPARVGEAANGGSGLANHVVTAVTLGRQQDEPTTTIGWGRAGRSCSRAGGCSARSIPRAQAAAAASARRRIAAYIVSLPPDTGAILGRDFASHNSEQSQMRILAASLCLALLTSSAMARNFDVGGNSKGDCDDRRQPNAQKCLYFGNPYYDAATGAFSSNINPYYDPATGTFSSHPFNYSMLGTPRRVRKDRH